MPLPQPSRDQLKTALRPVLQRIDPDQFRDPEAVLFQIPQPGRLIRLVSGASQASAKPNRGSVPIRKLTWVGLVRLTAAFWT